MRRVFRLPFPGGHTFLFGLANPRYRGRKIERGPFGCWERYFGWFKIGWVRTRWL